MLTKTIKYKYNNKVNKIRSFIMNKINFALIIASIAAFKFGYLLLAVLSLSVVFIPMIFKSLGITNSKVLVK